MCEKHKAKFIERIQISENICLIFQLKSYNVIWELH